MADDFDAYLAESLEEAAFAREYVHATARGALRDRVAWAVCGWILRHVATKHYRDWIDGAIRYGMLAAARDAAEDRPAPWRP